MEQLYRWVKASESIDRLPLEKVLHIQDNVGLERMGNFYKDEGNILMLYIQPNGAHNGYYVEQKNFDHYSWLEPIPDSNQESLWLDVKEIFMRHYEAHNYPYQATKELSSKYIIVKR